MPYDNIDLRATTRLPGLDIEIVHRQSPDGLTEQVSINLTAVPSFGAFAGSLEAWNPFAALSPTRRGRGSEAVVYTLIQTSSSWAPRLWLGDIFQPISVL